MNTEGAASSSTLVSRLAFHTAFITAVIIFLMCLFFVFFGFVGYFSRVNLNTEFEKADQKIDYVFMMVDQIVADEHEISSLRERQNKTKAEAQETKNKTQAVAFLSDEFKEYFDAVVRIQNFVEEVGDSLTINYRNRVYGINVEEPDIDEVRRLSVIDYNEGVTVEIRKRVDESLIKSTKDLRAKMLAYMIKYRGSLKQVDDREMSTLQEIDGKIRSILTRSPQLGFDDELTKYRLTKPQGDDIGKRSMIQERAVLRSYDEALRGLGGVFLRLPTIVSTLVVTLATGLLGGLVSFMGAAIQTRAKRPDGEGAGEPQWVSLVRRAILGVTAALGIFLFFGSGLLVLTAQSGKSVGANSLELSPYFVAFLAFISGFLADDAFARLKSAGQGIFQTDSHVESRNAREESKNLEETKET